MGPCARGRGRSADTELQLRRDPDIRGGGIALRAAPSTRCTRGWADRPVCATQPPHREGPAAVLESQGCQALVQRARRHWAASSAGRAPRSQRGGQEFDPPAVHQPHAGAPQRPAYTAGVTTRHRPVGLMAAIALCLGMAPGPAQVPAPVAPSIPAPSPSAPSPAAASAPALPPAELARRVQARYDTVRDFEGAFTQTYEGGVLRTKTTERGTVVIKRPGRMRWVYTAPERKEFVSNGDQALRLLPRRPPGDRQRRADRRRHDAGAVPDRAGRPGARLRRRRPWRFRGRPPGCWA